MASDLFTLEQVREPVIALAQVFDPYRGVGQGHRERLLTTRRRRGALSDGSLPPSAASRLALSRAMSALSPSCTSDVFSRTPVRSRAFVISSSSRINVVRICIKM